MIGAIGATAAVVGLYILSDRARRRSGAMTRERQQQMETALRESGEKLREAESVRTLTAGLLRGQERERRRIARELHDGINQMLAALSMELSALQDQIAASEAARKRLSSVDDRVMAISDEVRRVSHQLHPSILEHAGLVAALRSRCREFSKQTGIQSQVVAGDGVEPSDPEVAAPLFRMVQEALQNVARHCGAAEVRMTVSGDHEGVRLSIADNGRGFVVARERSRGLGLLSLSERARSWGGRLSIESPHHGGVIVSVCIPPSTGPADSRGTLDPFTGG